jgi:hypothetical protein
MKQLLKARLMHAAVAQPLLFDLYWRCFMVQPKSMRSLTVILSEYITLKTFEAHAAAEKARTNQLLQTLYGLLEDFRPGSSKGGHLQKLNTLLFQTYIGCL